MSDQAQITRDAFEHSVYLSILNSMRGIHFTKREGEALINMVNCQTRVDEGDRVSPAPQLKPCRICEKHPATIPPHCVYCAAQD